MTLYLIVAGSRGWCDYALMNRKLDHLTQNYNHVVVISGCARGADTLCERWAHEHGHEVEQFPADWNTYGRQAGNLRNLQMLDYAQSREHCGVVAFWDGKSRGTRHLFKTAEIRGVPLRVIRRQQ